MISARSLKNIQKQLDVLEGERQAFNLQHHNKVTAVEAQAKRLKFECHNCHKKSPLSEYIYVQTLYFVDDPYNAYWENGERQLECPLCHVHHRFLSDESKKVALKILRKDYFKVTTEVSRGDDYEFINL